MFSKDAKCPPSMLRSLESQTEPKSQVEVRLESPIRGGPRQRQHLVGFWILKRHVGDNQRLLEDIFENSRCFRIIPSIVRIIKQLLEMF